MITLRKRFSDMSSNLEKLCHHNDRHEGDNAYLRGFRSIVGSYIAGFTMDSDSEVSSLSLKRVEEYFKVLPLVNKAFAKLVAEIDYPMNRWGSESVDEYLRYTSKFMGDLNLISSCLHHLAQARVSLSIGLRLDAIPWLRPITVKELAGICEENEASESETNRRSNDRESIISAALKDVRFAWLMVCSASLDALTGNTMFRQKRGKTSLLPDSVTTNPESHHSGGRNDDAQLEELAEINIFTTRLAAALEAGQSCEDEVEEMSRKLVELEKLVDRLQTKVERLFNELLGTRGKLLDSIRLTCNTVNLSSLCNSL